MIFKIVTKERSEIVARVEYIVKAPSEQVAIEMVVGGHISPDYTEYDSAETLEEEVVSSERIG